MLLLSNPTIRLLFVAQVLYMSCIVIGFTLLSLIGLQLSPVAGAATAPLALMLLATLLVVQPLSRFMQQKGRRAGLLAGAVSGTLGALVIFAGVMLASFWLVCLGSALIGPFAASSNFFRFTAQDAVGLGDKGKAASYVLGGGVVAALIAPSLGLWSRNALVVPFAGSFLMMAALGLAVIVILLFLKNPAQAAVATRQPGLAGALLKRPLVRAAVAITAAGHGIMVLVMNATPLAMQFCSFGVDDTAMVIQWHVLGMFLPGFLSGPLVDRFGSRRVALAGVVLLLSSMALALSDVAFLNFLVASVLLGAGWNLMMVAGTTLLGEGHTPEERGAAQGLMELGNGSVGAFGALASGALIAGTGWSAVNLGIVPVLAVAMLVLASASLPRLRTAEGD
ncbi:MFS transporter [Novispirillum itersonii]|uniref:MFS family permease n=1 Tax=Novispirillum itersonii TaxID=189 RepID=A0A7W9ZDK2_NOVIT|nr:MFS transporter [Novispirillum itersonii]MBB6209496.1 MFS family permease [Novispirillum itersonii]